MKELNPKFRLIRESRWIKKYDTGEGIVFDSKYRTFECDADAAQFAELWRIAPPDERADMEAAFPCFPAEVVDELEPIFAGIGQTDPEAAAHLRQVWIAESESVASYHGDFLTQLMQYLYKQGVQYRCIGENKYFRVLSNGSDFQIESQVKAAEGMPSAAELTALERNATPPLYRQAVRIVRRCRFLLEPENGTLPHQ